jgi:hypothetical protein
VYLLLETIERISSHKPPEPLVNSKNETVELVKKEIIRIAELVYG